MWGRRPLLLGGLVITTLTSLLLPLVEARDALLLVSGLSGLGTAAFSPASMALVTDAARPGAAGRAFAWYTTALYTAFSVGPMLGGLIADWGGARTAFVASGVIVGAAVVLCLAFPAVGEAPPRAPAHAEFAQVRRDPRIWAAWLAAVAGLAVQGAMFTYFPLLAQERGHTPSLIGLVFGVQAFANTLARIPAGRFIDRSGVYAPWTVGGVVIGALATVLLPHVTDRSLLLLLSGAMGAVLGVAFVGIGTALAEAATPRTRGLVMGGYSTAIYLGLALAAFTLGPAMTHLGYPAGFAIAGVAGVVMMGGSAALWAAGGRRPDQL